MNYFFPFVASWEMCTCDETLNPISIGHLRAGEHVWCRCRFVSLPVLSKCWLLHLCVDQFQPIQGAQKVCDSVGANAGKNVENGSVPSLIPIEDLEMDDESEGEGAADMEEDTEEQWDEGHNTSGPAQDWAWQQNGSNGCTPLLLNLDLALQDVSCGCCAVSVCIRVRKLVQTDANSLCIPYRR